jgi:hypothetical protein
MGSNGNYTLLDHIQGPSSIAGRSAGAPLYDAYTHNLQQASPPPDIDNIPIYHSYEWWGLINGLLTLKIKDNRAIGAANYTGANLTLQYATPIPTGVCTHCAFTIDWNSPGSGGTAKLYVNGAEVASASLPTQNSGINWTLDYSSINMGNCRDSAFSVSNITGAFQEYYIYYSVLSASEILAEANACPGPVNAPVVWMQLDGVSDIVDRNGAKAITLVGLATSDPSCCEESGGDGGAGDTDNSSVCACQQGDVPTTAAGGGQGNGSTPQQTPLINAAGTPLPCDGGGLVPTAADLVFSEVWWGAA